MSLKWLLKISWPIILGVHLIFLSAAAITLYETAQENRATISYLTHRVSTEHSRAEALVQVVKDQAAQLEELKKTTHNTKGKN